MYHRLENAAVESSQSTIINVDILTPEERKELDQVMSKYFEEIEDTFGKISWIEYEIICEHPPIKQ